MTDLPASTKVGRVIAKEKFYTKTAVNSKLRQLFTSEIEKITWANKIAPDTLNITANEYAELQVFEISLKGTNLSTPVLKHIDTFIPYPILFILKHTGSSKAVLSFKEPATRSIDQMKVDSYYETPWQQKLTLELKGRSVDEIYKHYLFQIAPDLQQGNQVEAKIAVEQNRSRVAIQKQIDLLNQQIRNEISISKRQELARQRFELENSKNDIVAHNITRSEPGEI